MVDEVLLLSGGLDSLVLLAKELNEGHKPLCLSFAYGQSHETRENLAAIAIADYYHVQHELYSLPTGLFRGSALTGNGKRLPIGVPSDDPSQSTTVVPGRNLAMLALATSIAVQVGAKRVLFGANANDNTIYPDCRWSFVRALGSAMAEGYGVQLAAPLLSLPKSQVVKMGRDLNVPLELSWSCYMGQATQCNVCGACKARSLAGA